MNYVLYGGEHYLLQSALKRIVKENIVEENEFNTISYDALQTNLQTILEDAMTIPFFAEKKVILVYHANFLSTTNDTEIDVVMLDKYLDNPVESSILVFIGEFDKLDARKKIVKKVQKTCKVLQFRKLDAAAKQNYIVEDVNKRGLRITKDGMSELIARLPCDIHVIRMELDKLELYGTQIDIEVVSKLITRPLEEDVFLLVNAVVEKNIREAFAIWYDLCVLNKDAIYLIALLASQFRFLYQVKALMMQGAKKDRIVSELGAHPYRVQLTMQSAERLSIAYVLHILEKLATLDQKLKSGRLDKKLGFEMFLIELQGVR